MTVDTLRARVTGDVLVPGSAAYESARMPAMTRFRQVRPQAVVRCATAADVAATLGYAREHGIHVTPRSGGHWALRGAGGGLGVVTSLAFDTVPAPEATRFEVSLSEAGAADVIAAWQDWAPDAPDGMSASLKIAATGDGPAVVTVFGSMLGTQAEAEHLLSGLLDESGVRPVSASHQLMGYRRLKESLVGVGGDERPGEAFSRSEFFRGPLPAEAIERLLRVFGEDRVPACSRELNFTAMGGAYNRVAPDATAFVHRDERFIVEHALVVRGEAAQVTGWVDRSYDCVHAWGSGRVYPNFPDPGLTNWAQAYHGGNYERLLQVKQTYDPERLFRFHQSL